MALINTFQGGHLRQHKRNPESHRPHCRSRGDAGATEFVPSLVKNWQKAATDKEHTKAQSLPSNGSTQKKKNPEHQKAREEPVWSAEAMNACWTSGWKRTEVTGATGEALEEKNADERTADAINDLLVTTVTNAASPLLAKRPKDEEEWVIRSRAQVSKLLMRRSTQERGVRPRRRGAPRKGLISMTN